MTWEEFLTTKHGLRIDNCLVLTTLFTAAIKQ